MAAFAATCAAWWADIRRRCSATTTSHAVSLARATAVKQHTVSQRVKRRATNRERVIAHNIEYGTKYDIPSLDGASTADTDTVWSAPHPTMRGGGGSSSGSSPSGDGGRGGGSSGGSSSSSNSSSSSSSSSDGSGGQKRRLAQATTVVAANFGGSRAGAIESLQTQSRPGHGPGRAAALMQRAGRGVSLRQAGREEQREYDRAGFADPVSARPFGRSHPVTKNAAAFMNQIDQRKATSDSRTGFARSGEGDVDASALHSIASSCSDTSLAPCAMNLSRYLPHNLGLCVGAGAPAGDVREQEACLPEAAAAALHALLCEPRELRPAEPHRATPPQAFQQWRRRRWR
eukprot:COSAG01_NODE_13944_length_1515_cov_5.698446_1_plen_344_part_10